VHTVRRRVVGGGESGLDDDLDPARTPPPPSRWPSAGFDLARLDEAERLCRELAPRLAGATFGEKRALLRRSSAVCSSTARPSRSSW
jgi:hypothetical protein